MNSNEAYARLTEIGAVLQLDQMDRVDCVDIRHDLQNGDYEEMYRRLSPAYISIDGAKFVEEDVFVVANLRNLTSINANLSGVSPVLLRHFDLFPNVECLAVSSTPVCHEDLVSLDYNATLRTLHLANTSVGNASLKHIGTISMLEILDLRDTLVDDSGLPHLYELRNLFTVDLRGSAVTPSGKDLLHIALMQHLPDIEVLL